MFNKIKTSLLVQTSFLFFTSFLVIILLWIFFYIQQKQQHLEYDTARYFNTASSLQNYLFEDKQISNKELKIFAMTLYEGFFESSKIFLEKGNSEKGFKVILYKNKTLLYIYRGEKKLVLEDISTHKTMIIIHLVFILLLIMQFLLYLKLEKSLSPLSSLHKKLKKLKDGDLSPLIFESSYVEIKQMINSYNISVSKIEYILELREMFNKIFMHEMKMPMAKGMFYLKQKPSNFTHEKLNEILCSLNKQLDEFSKLESLIEYQNKIEIKEYYFLELFEEARNRIFYEDKKIELKNCKGKTLKGDKEFWILCIKNLLDNALKYSVDNKVLIDGKNGFTFINKGEELPMDISKNNWKISKNKRHKSSSGYGFGLFIIKNIVSLHSYTLEYKYEDNSVFLRIK